MDGFYFDIGIDPNYRLADSADSLSSEKTMMRLFHFMKQHGISGELDAKVIPPIEAYSHSIGYEIGASILRDCYGKVNYFFAASDAPVFDDIAKVFKAYKKNIKIISVSVGDTQRDSVSVYADTFIHVPQNKAAAAAAQLNDLEKLHVDTVSGGVLQAAAEEAVKINDKHARYVILLTHK